MNDVIMDILPTRFIVALSKIEIKNGYLEEIRIRRARQAYIVAGGSNHLLNVVATDDEMATLLSRISRNSLYAYKNTISNGYIPYGSGIRIGLIGRASLNASNITGVYDISEICIRIPNELRVNCAEIEELIGSGRTIPSILIYSPPGVGKTTLLRELIRRLSSSKYSLRVCVIDTRDELSYSLNDKSLLVSILSSYPRRIGLEIAMRTLNAQVIVCDEIGDPDDSSAIIDTQTAGVPLIASCHGSSIADIITHTGIKSLHAQRIFDYYIGLERGDSFDFRYNVTKRDDLNDYL